MIYLHSGGGVFEKQARVNQVATEKAQEIAKNKIKQVVQFRSIADFPVELEKIGAILLIEPTIELALEVGRQYSQSTDIVIAESATVGRKLTVCQIEFAVTKICVL
ncbi:MULTISPECIES: hypothetical protein [Proteus]|uniref:hypothetical protein n=1 Tax=Proteus TaxID=583 RepID=UPI000BFB6BEC|nr:MULTISPECIES: hypothetical protein [Proteus]ATN00113.1 hypothetical protein CRN77_10420 [Proteus vulgaris]MBG2839062.1 hypothetical protein [Proteus terrae subsp. cibarius]MBG2869882.1 hypothetical protein [Proteus terrae subsp. cibarius]MCO7051613.1 hypothetical protein [Proteus terrae]MCS6715672.1 hypothetical protein [Proteus terrae]